MMGLLPYADDVVHVISHRSVGPLQSLADLAAEGAEEQLGDLRLDEIQKLRCPPALHAQ